MSPCTDSVYEKKMHFDFFPASFFRKKKLEKKPNDGNGRKRKDR